MRSEKTLISTSSPGPSDRLESTKRTNMYCPTTRTTVAATNAQPGSRSAASTMSRTHLDRPGSDRGQMATANTDWYTPE
jgi:hypothetical protein